MKKIVIALFCLALGGLNVFAGNYRSFKLSVYARAYEVEKMSDPEYLESTWKTISSQVKIDRIYLETHRDTRIVPQETLDAAKKFFRSHGVEVAGGITYTIDERDNYRTFCYTTPEQRALAQKIAEYTARNFDEFILDEPVDIKIITSEEHTMLKDLVDNSTVKADAASGPGSGFSLTLAPHSYRVFELR